MSYCWHRTRIKIICCAKIWSYPFLWLDKYCVFLKMLVLAVMHFTWMSLVSSSLYLMCMHHPSCICWLWVCTILHVGHVCQIDFFVFAILWEHYNLYCEINCIIVGFDSPMEAMEQSAGIYIQQFTCWLCMQMTYIHFVLYLITQHSVNFAQECTHAIAIWYLI